MIVRFYKETTFASLDNYNVWYEEDEPKNFKLEMELKIMDALMGQEWDQDRKKKGYTRLVEN